MLACFPRKLQCRAPSSGRASFCTANAMIYQCGKRDVDLLRLHSERLRAGMKLH
jgi:hypothetical protein